MLNTESRGGAFAIWAAITGLVAHAIWIFLGWPGIADATHLVLASESAAFASRNQILIAGLAGFGGLALAYLWNGWRNRSEALHALERQERRLGGVLASEATALADACEAAARQLAGKAGGGGVAISGLARSIKGSEHALLSMSAADLARLGPGAAAAARNIRTAVRGLGEALDLAKPDDTGNRHLAVRAMETALIARTGASVLEALGKRGVEAADALRTMPLPVASDIEKLLGPAGNDGGAKASRLHTVA